MPSQKKPTFIEHFKEINDPRTRHTKYELEDIFFMALCALICGCDSWVAVEKFCQLKRPWFEDYLELDNGIPSHDTFGRVFSLIEPTQFQKCFSRWIQAVVEHVIGDVVAIDGKCLRGSHEKGDGKAAIHMVSAWSSSNQLVLGQVKVDEKSNEITALPTLLKNLDISGATVTADAIHTQRKTAELIVGKGANYLLALKGNRSTLHDEVALFFEQTPKAFQKSLRYHEALDAGHGRIERREICATDQIDWLKTNHDFPHLASIVKVTSTRIDVTGESKEHRYYISSHAHKDAERFGHFIRAHWGIENCLHWSLDMAFDEDSCRVRAGHADQNLATLRHLAINLLKSETSAKVGVKIKRQMAGWDPNYLLKVLQLT